MRMNRSILAVCLSLAATSTWGATITSGSGNDCSGVFGTGFENCVFDYGDYETPIIAKLGWGEEEGDDEYNTSAFPSLSGSEAYVSDSSGTDGWFNVIYDPEADDPAMTVFIVKAANGWTAYDSVNNGTEGYFTFVEGIYTLFFKETNTSHVSIYDTASEVPLPAAGFLLLGGLGGLAMFRRRK